MYGFLMLSAITITSFVAYKLALMALPSERTDDTYERIIIAILVTIIVAVLWGEFFAQFVPLDI